VSWVTLQSLQYAVNAIFGHFNVSGLSSATNVVVLVGVAMLLAIIVVGGVVLLVKGVKAMGNMTPGRFLAALIGMAVAFIIIGALLP
jgi:hypothetical protein